MADLRGMTNRLAGVDRRRVVAIANAVATTLPRSAEGWDAESPTGRGASSAPFFERQLTRVAHLAASSAGTRNVGAALSRYCHDGDSHGSGSIPVISLVI